MSTVYVAPLRVYQTWNDVPTAYVVTADGRPIEVGSRSDLAAQIRATIVLDRGPATPPVSPATYFRYEIGEGAQLWGAPWGNIVADYLVAAEQPREGDRIGKESDCFSLPDRLARA